MAFSGHKLHVFGGLMYEKRNDFLCTLKCYGQIEKSTNIWHLENESYYDHDCTNNMRNSFHKLQSMKIEPRRSVMNIDTMMKCSKESRWNVERVQWCCNKKSALYIVKQISPHTLIFLHKTKVEGSLPHDIPLHHAHNFEPPCINDTRQKRQPVFLVR